MKTLKALLLTAVLAPALVACGGKEAPVGDLVQRTVVEVGSGHTAATFTPEVKCKAGTVNLVTTPMYKDIWMTSQASYDIAFQQAVSDGMGDIAGQHGSYVQGIVNTALSQACN